MSDKSIRLGIGALESKVLSDLVAEGKTIFSIKELAEKTGSKVKARKMASALVKKKWLERVNKGTYLVLELAAGSKPEWTEDSFYIASKLADPYYIGFYNMINYFHWTEQIPFTVTIVTTKTLKPKMIHETKYEFVTVSKHKFFGFTRIHIHGHWINISDSEKTIIDILDNPNYVGIEEIAKSLYNAKNIDWNKLIDYGIRMKNKAIFKRLGFLLELMEIKIPTEAMEKIKKNISKGYAFLWPGIKNKKKYNSKWNIIENTEITKEKALA